MKTIKVPSFALSLATFTNGGVSLSVIVPVAVAVPSVAFTGAGSASSVSVKVSPASGSSALSSMIGTDIVPVVAPAAIVSVPVVATKSAWTAVSPPSTEAS